MENYVTNDNIVLNHYPDKTKSRSSYLKLLELSVKEYPESDRNLHYLGREYMYYNKDKKSIKTLKSHLKHPNSKWNEERCASMRFIARCYNRLGNNKLALKWANKAILECPNIREPYMEKALIEYNLNNYNDAINLCYKSLDIIPIKKTYINEIFTTNLFIYDLLSILEYNKKNYDISLYWVNRALIIRQDERLINNKIIIEKQIK